MELSQYVSQVDEASSFIRDRFAENVDLGIILGTGLDPLMDSIEVVQSIDYEDIPHFPHSTVESHSGSLVYGKVGSRHVLVLRGRMHIYEGYSAREVTFPIRVFGALDIKNLVVSNASGGINTAYRSGDIMLIEDHINLMGHNPLEGENHADWGPRFPDMSDPYITELRVLAREKAAELGITLHEGVYLAVVGPNLETRAEYQMLGRMGADVVGMSTVPEVLVANHMGMRVLAFSIVTDECFPDTLQPISLQEVIAAAAKASPALTSLLSSIIPHI